jgi:hypothetical protein
MTTVSTCGGAALFVADDALVRATFGVEAGFFGGTLAAAAPGFPAVGGFVGWTKVGFLNMGCQNSGLNFEPSSSLDGVCGGWSALGANGLFDFMPPLVGGTARVGDARALLDRLPEGVAEVGPGSKVLASNLPFQACCENFVLMESVVPLNDFSN